MFRELDCVILTNALPGTPLKVGMRGTILLIHPSTGGKSDWYEVEFMDSDSTFIGETFTVLGDYLVLDTGQRYPDHPAPPPRPASPPPSPSYTSPPPQPKSSAGWFVLGAILLVAAIAFLIHQQNTSAPRPQQQAFSPQAPSQQPISMPISQPPNSATTMAFEESFNHAPDYDDNWIIALQSGSFTTTYTPGNFRIQAPPVTTAGNGGSGVTYRSKQGFVGDFDASFQLNHGGYGRTTVGLWSANSNQVVIQSILDTNDTAYLGFGSGPSFTEYTYSSGPYMNKWITLRIQVVGNMVNFYADNGTGPQLLKTWPVPSSTPDSYFLAFGAASVSWKAGPNDTSFRRISVLTPVPATPNAESAPPPAPVYKPSVVRVSGPDARTERVAGFKVTIPKTDDWFDTGIPLIVQGDAYIEAEEPQAGRVQFQVKLNGENETYSAASPVLYHPYYTSVVLGGSDDMGQLLNTIRTVQLKILDNVPGATFNIILKDSTNLINYFMPRWQFDPQRQALAVRRDSLIQQISTQ